MKCSIVIPAHNEAENIPTLEAKIREHFPECEVIWVDDGSTDETLSRMQALAGTKVIHFEKRRGQSAALFEGIRHAHEAVIATLDADLQNDPKDLKKLLKKLEAGYDLVCGWRKVRRDSRLKRVASWVGNEINRWMLGVPLHDNNCSLKVFQKRCLEQLEFFDYFHRFLPFLLQVQGYRIGEETVGHTSRQHGRSKYGIFDRICGNLAILIRLRFRYRRSFRKKPPPPLSRKRSNP